MAPSTGESAGAAGTSADLRQDEAVPLGYALVTRVARDVGIRCLAIKGPVLEVQELRSGYASVDVDVLADPVRAEDLAAALAGMGWRPRTPSTTAHMVPKHSVTVAHPAWPVEVDLHDRFPGFLADPAVVFEALWERRTTIPLAGVEVPCTDVVGSAAVALLHVLRDPVRRRAELERLVPTVRDRLSEQQLDELVELAGRTGSSATLLPALGLPVPPPVRGQAEAETAWRIRTASSGMHSVGWAYELSTTPLRRWPGVLRRAALLTEPEIRLLYPQARPGPLGLLEGRVRRLRVGLRALPEAVRLVVRMRRSG